MDLQCIVETNYILSGNLDVKQLLKKLRKSLKDFKFINSKSLKNYTFFSTDYPRFLDRIETARLLSKHSHNFGFLERVEISC